MSVKQFVNNNFPLSSQVNAILNHALQSVDPEICTKKAISILEDEFNGDGKFYKLDASNSIKIIGFGKAVYSMAMGIEANFGFFPYQGVIISKHEPEPRFISLKKKYKLLHGSHPGPSIQSIKSSRELLRFLDNKKNGELVICLISGGGSSLFTIPYKGIKLSHMQDLTNQLLETGASINEINTIRKHIDEVKGGGLMRKIFPSKSISFILSDVLGDDISMIASGPTAADSTTFRDALDIINKYHLENKVNNSIIKCLKDGVNKKIPETIKEEDYLLSRHTNLIIGSLNTAARAAAEKAEMLGFKTEILSLRYEGEARDVGKELGKIVKEKMGQQEKNIPFCYIAGGEPTVTITGFGRGGRNQEVALSAAVEVDGIDHCLIVALATDGEDGPTDAAGAYVNGKTVIRGGAMGLNAQESLNHNDSYHFFQKTKELIKIGPTGTNVNDLYLVMIY